MLNWRAIKGPIVLGALEEEMASLQTKNLTFTIFALVVFILGFVSSYSDRVNNLLWSSSIVRSNLAEVNPFASREPIFYERKLARYSQEIAGCLSGDELLKKIVCINDRLREISSKNGARVGLDVVQTLSDKYPEIVYYNHDFAHTIGTNAVKYKYPGYKEVKKGDEQFSPEELSLIQRIGVSLVDCDGWGAFGCYHGVIEAGLSKLPPTKRTSVIKKACMENPLIQSHRAFVNQCLHWFGHGMSIFTDQSLLETLGICDGLNKTWTSDDVQLCISGVFHSGAQPGEVDERYIHFLDRVYSKDDVYFPCLDVPEKFRGQCFGQVPGRTGPVLEEQLQNCINIPEDDPKNKLNFIHRCLNSAGNNVLVETKSAAGVVDTCRKYLEQKYWKYCYEGAVRYSILRNPLLNNSVPFQICELAEKENKETCYKGLGAGNYENYFSMQILKDFCALVKEKEYSQDCFALSIPD